MEAQCEQLHGQWLRLRKQKKEAREAERKVIVEKMDAMGVRISSIREVISNTRANLEGRPRVRYVDNADW